MHAGPAIYTRPTVEMMLRPYGCRYAGAHAFGTYGYEKWVTGWDDVFTLRAYQGGYDERQVREFLRFAQSSAPPGWPR